MKTTLSLATSALLSIQAWAHSSDTQKVFGECIEVVSVSDTPSIQSGPIAVWMEISGRNNLGEKRDYYIPYVSKQYTRVVESQCYIEFRLGDVSGLVEKNGIARSVTKSEARIVQQILCEKP